MCQIVLFCSPVKFAGGDCWTRVPMRGGSPGEQPMDVSMEQIDTSSSNTSEASAPLPIRHPSGIQEAPYKKQAYPLNSKRPEHLRMNLWPSFCLQTLGFFQFLYFLIFFFSEETRRTFTLKIDTFDRDHQLFEARLLLLGVQSGLLGLLQPPTAHV